MRRRRARARAGAVVVAVGVTTYAALLAFGGPVPYAPGTAAYGPRGPGPEAALARWATFDASSARRPIVLLQARVQYPGRFGRHARIPLRGSVRMPNGPASVGGVPVRSAAAALRDLAGPALKSSPKRYRIAGVALRQVPYWTDRGQVPLPAWVFRVRGLGDVSVLAVRSPSIVVDRTLHWSSDDVRGSAAGRELTLRFVGSRPGHGPCAAQYTPLVRESATAVAVGYLTHPGRAPFMSMFTGGYICTLEGYSRSVDVRLARPLGNRIVVDYATGEPLMVHAGERIPYVSTARHGAPLAAVKERAGGVGRRARAAAASAEAPGAER